MENSKVIGVALDRAAAIAIRDSITNLNEVLPREQMVAFEGDTSPGSKDLEGKVAIVLDKDAVQRLHDGEELSEDIEVLHKALLMAL